MFHSDFRQLLVILLKLWLNFRNKPAAESGLLPLPIPFARKKIVDSEVWSWLMNIMVVETETDWDWAKDVETETLSRVSLISVGISRHHVSDIKYYG